MAAEAAPAAGGHHRALMPARIWYFFYFSGLVCLWPYINLYFRSNGLSDAQIGVLGALRPWVNAPASFLWSGLADAKQAHKAILIGTLVASTIVNSGMAFFHTFAAYVVLVALGQFLAAPVGVLADAAVMSACQEDGDYGKTRLWGAVGWGGFSTLTGWAVQQYGMQAGFIGLVLCMIPGLVAAWFLPYSSMSLKVHQNDGIAATSPGVQLEMSRAWSLPLYPAQASPSRPNSCNLNQEQVDQALKASKAADGCERADALQGLLVCEPDDTSAKDNTGDAKWRPDGYVHLEVSCQQEQTKDCGCSSSSSSSRGGSFSSSGGSSSSSSAHGTQQACGERELQQLRRQQEQPHRQQTQHKQQHANELQNHQQPQPPSIDFWSGLRQLLTTPAVLVFMAQATVMGFGIGVIGEFLFLFLQELGGSSTLMGLSLTITCAAEIPAFHYQGAVLKVVSVTTLLHVVLLTYFLRLALYGMLPWIGSAWAVLPIELLHGITFACGWGAGTINSKRVAPPGLEATMQGIFQGLYFGLGQGLGALIGGLLMQRYGGQAMFFICSVITLAGWLLCAAAQQAEHIAGWCSSRRTLKASSKSSSVVRANSQHGDAHDERRSLIGRYGRLSVQIGDVEVGGAAV